MKTFFTAIGLFICCNNSFGQSDNARLAMNALLKLSETYNSSKQLSFDIKYLYASEQSPAVVLDSLQGSFKLDADRYWYSLDSTETLSDGGKVIVLYKEDKVMYLTKASNAGRSLNQMLSIDSLLSKSDGVAFSIKKEKTNNQIRIVFPDGKSCKWIEYTIDSKTGYLKQMIQLVKDELLYDPGISVAAEQNSKYSIITTLFSHYESGTFGEGFFDAGRYYRKSGSDFTACKPYENYKVFLGSTDL
jgi:hypothetical protein